jgi:hypothetical protein
MSNIFTTHKDNAIFINKVLEKVKKGYLIRAWA